MDDPQETYINVRGTSPGTKHREVRVSREGTSPWTGEGRTMQEQLSRKPVGTGGVRVKHDYMDAGGTSSGMCEVEFCQEQEPRATHGFEHGSSYIAQPRDGRERFSCREAHVLPDPC